MPTELHSFFQLSSGQIVATGLLTAVFCQLLLYGLHRYLWATTGLGKAFKPAFWDVPKHLKEYFAVLSRVQRKERRLKVGENWLSQLGHNRSSSPLTVLADIERLVDREKGRGKKGSALQSLVLQEFHAKAMQLLHTNSARKRLLADQKAMESSAPAKVVASTAHPISTALRDSKKVSAPAPAKDWAEILGVTTLHQEGRLTMEALRKAYRTKQAKAKNNIKQLQRIQEAMKMARKELGFKA